MIRLMRPHTPFRKLLSQPKPEWFQIFCFDCQIRNALLQDLYLFQILRRSVNLFQIAYTVTLFCDPLVQHLFAPTRPCVQPGLCFFGAIVGCPIAGQTIVFQPLGYFFAEFCVAQCDTPFKNPSTAQTSPSGHLSGACHPAGHPGYPAGPCKFHPVPRFR